MNWFLDLLRAIPDVVVYCVLIVIDFVLVIFTCVLFADIMQKIRSGARQYSFNDWSKTVGSLLMHLAFVFKVTVGVLYIMCNIDVMAKLHHYYDVVSMFFCTLHI